MSMTIYVLGTINHGAEASKVGLAAKVGSRERRVHHNLGVYFRID